MTARGESSEAPRDRYRWAAPIYDAATLLWSGGAIWRTRAHALRHAAPGVRFFVPGAGTGRLAIEAAARGAATVALEPSPTMRARARRRLEKRARGRSADGVHGTLEIRDQRLEAFDDPEGFNVVVAEHFLNVFRPADMPGVRERLIELVRPGGLFIVADFAPMADSIPWPARMAQSVHHWVPLGGCALLTRNALHPIYDHGRDLVGRSDIRLEAFVDEPSFRIGPRWFRAWTFRKLQVPGSGAPASPPPGA